MHNDRDPHLTPDLPPPVAAPELWRDPRDAEAGPGDAEAEKPPDPEHGPGDDTATGEPPD